MVKKLLQICSLFMLPLLLVACSTTTRTQTGFLNDYSGFTESPYYKGVMVDRSGIHKIKNYRKFMIDPVMVYWSRTSDNIGVDSSVLDDLTTYFDEQLEEALGDRYDIVTTPGDGVLRIRLAVTDVVPSNPALNVHWATKMTKAGIGGASMEAEFIDSVTQERIAAVVDDRQGRGLQMHKGFSKWGYTKDAFLQWAKMLRERLDDFHGYE